MSLQEDKTKRDGVTTACYMKLRNQGHSEVEYYEGQALTVMECNYIYPTVTSHY